MTESAHRLPAEWEPHAATWIAWPHRRATWVGDFGPIPEFFARFIGLLARFEPVNVIGSGEVLRDARSRLAGVAGVEFVEIPTSDSWLRDTGPVFLVPRRRGRRGATPLTAVCWEWNAWGGKYPPWDDDARVSRAIAARLGVPAVEPGLVLEGGAIETDGAGTLLVNHRCVDSPTRNPGVPRPRIEDALRERLGIDRVIWIGGDLAGDDTDGHIDQLARFVAPGRVVAARQPDRLDPNHPSLEENLALLESTRDAGGGRLDVIPIELPPRFSFAGQQLPASYLNFYVANGAVLVPVFFAATDEPACRTLAACFPGRRIVPVDCRDLIRGRGALHCITRDQPAV